MNWNPDACKRDHRFHEVLVPDDLNGSPSLCNRANAVCADELFGSAETSIRPEGVKHREKVRVRNPSAQDAGVAISEQNAGTQAVQLPRKGFQDRIGCCTQGAVRIELTDIRKFGKPHLRSAKKGSSPRTEHLGAQNRFPRLGNYAISKNYLPHLAHGHGYRHA
jgi:hypothetical protein